MATPTGIAAAARQAASGFALRALPPRKTYTTSWDINSATGREANSDSCAEFSESGRRRDHRTQIVRRSRGAMEICGGDRVAQQVSKGAIAMVEP